MPLDPEQVAAVRLACGEDGSVGRASPAGAGKGAVLQAVVAAHQQAGGKGRRRDRRRRHRPAPRGVDWGR